MILGRNFLEISIGSIMARPQGFEPWSEDSYSSILIPLNYSRKLEEMVGTDPTAFALARRCSTIEPHLHLDRMKGLEPSLLVWKTRALPLMQHPDWQGLNDLHASLRFWRPMHNYLYQIPIKIKCMIFFRPCISYLFYLINLHMA